MNKIEIIKHLGELKSRVDQLEARLNSVEQSVTGALDQFGRYKSRTFAELKDMHNKISPLINIVESLVAASEHGAAAEQAKNLRSRLLNNKTRIERELKERNNRG